MNEHSLESLEQTLIALEDQAWQALSHGTGADFYQRNLAPHALMVFPIGVLSREAAIESLRTAPPWATYQIRDPAVIKLSDTSAMLTYLATAQRSGDAPYTARMSTAFVKHDGGWKTVFHQQTPVTE